MNMLATECSRPSATKALMGNQMATAFPEALLQALAIHTAAHTSQLQRIPRVKACTAFFVWMTRLFQIGSFGLCNGSQCELSSRSRPGLIQITICRPPCLLQC